MVCGCTSTSPEGQTPSPTEVTTTVPVGEETETVTETETMTETVAETETMAENETEAVNETGTEADNETATTADIIGVATDAGTFTTLLTALDTADLTTALQEEGPYTVFAPNDAAFEALPAGTLDDLLANTTELTSVLQYHVVPGEYDAASLEGLETLETLEGEMLNVSITDGVVTVDGATVITADIEASNGVIHEIDAVMLPSSVAVVEEASENETTENETTENETTET
ncbi:fasciclin domain-containing protein [Methanofollis formosanus]|uniref:Fasciclin domain-containing protein n=2 Tax=Methanofollis formosanus TaxID=299308 RepID=A0A8G1A3F9_9EURY|nr:fasciclin domain-containing protein [Methanofollis formosanus]